MSSKPKIKPIYKFTLHNKLEEMSRTAYKQALIDLPKLLSINNSQFQKYRYAKLDSGVNLKFEKVLILSIYLKCPIEDLYTDLDNLIKKVEDSKNKDFNFLG